jgi:general secretion pathway protein G
LHHDLNTIRDAISQFHEDLNRYPDSLIELVERKYLRSYPIDPVTGRYDTWIFYAPPENDQTGIYNLKSGAGGVTTDGIPYDEL